MQGEKAGFGINEFCVDAGLSRATYYVLPAKSKPHAVNIGKKVVITESPAAWLARMRKAGGVKMPKRKPKKVVMSSAARQRAAA